MQAGKFRWPNRVWSELSFARDDRTKYASPRAGVAENAALVVRFDLTEGLGANDVDRRIAHARRAGDIGHRTIAFYLADCADRGLHQALGYPSAIPYAVKRHGIPRRCARDLIAAGRALRDLPRLDSAFADGGLAWSKVRAIARVAEPATEDAWLAFAVKHRIDEVEHAVALANKGDRPREERKGVPGAKFTLSLRVSALLHEECRQAREKLRAELGRDVKDEDFVGVLLEAYLRKRGDEATTDSLYRVVLDVNGTGEQASIRSEDGPVPVDHATAETMCCDAGVLTPEGGRHADYAPPISDSLRRRILARDGYRCLVCGSRFQLHVHHVVWRSHHGANSWGNLMAACRSCHTLVHSGFLAIAGTPPGALTFSNRDGESITEPASFVNVDGPRLEIGAAGGPIGPPAVQADPQRPAVDFSSLPTLVDARWMSTHLHLVSWDPKRTVLRLEAGHPIEGPAETSAEASPSGPIGPPDFRKSPEKPGVALRPTTFDEVVGQAAAVSSLRLAAEAARASGEVPDHVLFVGRPGLGKTTLARAFAFELGGRLRIVDSATLESPLTLIGHLINARENDIVFLDEIHALPQRISESLYGALEDGVLDLPFSDGVRTKTVRFVLPKMTFIGATTNPERMPEPLLARFPIREELEPYSASELAEIVRRAGSKNRLSVSDEAACILAKAALGCARTAISLYRIMRTVVRARRDSSASSTDALAALGSARIDTNGLGPVHRRVVDVLARHGRPMAIRRLARSAGVSVGSFRDLYEPALIELGAIVPTPRGLGLAAGWSRLSACRT